MTKRKRIPVTVVTDPSTIIVAQPKCQIRCVGDHMCVCAADKPHVYHICKRPDCECRDALREGVAA